MQIENLVEQNLLFLTPLIKIYRCWWNKETASNSEIFLILLLHHDDWSDVNAIKYLEKNIFHNSSDTRERIWVDEIIHLSGV